MMNLKTGIGSFRLRWAEVEAAVPSIRLSVIDLQRIGRRLTAQLGRGPHHNFA
jgi:hypothetical protein